MTKAEFLQCVRTWQYPMPDNPKFTADLRKHDREVADALDAHMAAYRRLQEICVRKLEGKR
jgi:hypothetical protein